MSILGRDPVRGRVWLQEPKVVLSGGAVREYVSDERAVDTLPRRSVGFVAAREVEPLLWEGDSA